MKKQLIKLLSALLLTLAVLSTTALNNSAILSPDTDTRVEFEDDIFED